jgi:hypothetical protein
MRYHFPSANSSIGNPALTGVSSTPFVVPKCASKDVLVRSALAALAVHRYVYNLEPDTVLKLIVFFEVPCRRVVLDNSTNTHLD